DLSIEGGHIESKALIPGVRRTMLIDRFFRSLARARKDNAIGVVFSGTGSDGTCGLAAIKGEGGTTFVQDVSTAPCAEMPRSARSFADYVMTPEQIANKLGRLAKARNGARLPLVESAPPTNDDSLRQIFGLIRSTGGVDF